MWKTSKIFSCFLLHLCKKTFYTEIMTCGKKMAKSTFQITISALNIVLVLPI